MHSIWCNNCCPSPLSVVPTIFLSVKERGPYVDRKTVLWRAAGADTFWPPISQPIFCGTRVPAVDVSQLHQPAPGGAQSSAAETGGPALLTAEICIPVFRKRDV